MVFRFLLSARAHHPYHGRFETVYTDLDDEAPSAADAATLPQSEKSPGAHRETARELRGGIL